MANLVLKPLHDRRRSDRTRHRVPMSRRVAMPGSTSFPSAHAASGGAVAQLTVAAVERLDRRLRPVVATPSGEAGSPPSSAR